MISHNPYLATQSLNAVHKLRALLTFLRFILTFLRAMLISQAHWMLTGFNSLGGTRCDLGWSSRPRKQGYQQLQEAGVNLQLRTVVNQETIQVLREQETVFISTHVIYQY